MNVQKKDEHMVIGFNNHEFCNVFYDEIGPALENSVLRQDYSKVLHHLNELSRLCSTDVDILKQIKSLNEYLSSNKYLDSTANDKIRDLLIAIEASKSDYVSILNKYIDIYSNSKKIQGVSLLCEELDKRTGGLLPGNLCTIAGGPGCMKTTYAVNICLNAVKSGYNVCYFSLEETPFNILNKIFSRISHIIGHSLSVQDITQNKLSDEDKSFLFHDLYDYFSNLKGCFHILGESDLGEYSTKIFEEKIQQVDECIKQEYFSKNHEPDHGIDILVIDHVQLLKYSENLSSNESEFSIINRYVSFFRKQCLSFLGTEREIIVILLSQVNREGIDYASKHNGNYKINQIAEASELERASSYIVTVYTDTMSQVSKLFKIGAVKLRGAALPLDTVNTYADGEFYIAGEPPIPTQKDYSMEDILPDNNSPSMSPIDINEFLKGELI